jgi:hypothetical protein
MELSPEAAARIAQVAARSSASTLPHSLGAGCDASVEPTELINSLSCLVFVPFRDPGTNQYAEAADYWRRYLASDCQSEWAARARRSLKFCEMQINLIASA